MATISYPATMRTPTEQMTGKAPRSVSKKVHTRNCDGCGKSYGQPYDRWGYIAYCPECITAPACESDEDHYDDIDALMDGHF